MAKKKPVPTKEEKKQAAQAKNDAETRMRIAGEGWPTWSENNRRLELGRLSKALEKQRQLQDRDAAQLPALIRQHVQLLEADDEKALKTWRAGPGAKATRERRFSMHDDFRAAQSLLEDFLYYQITVHRRGRLRVLTSGHYDINVKGGPRGNPKFPWNRAEPFRKKMLDWYDSCKIGGTAHRAGLRDWGGEEVARNSTDPPKRPVLPNELHLWLPVYRKRPVGFASRPHGDSTINPNEPTLDAEAITARWKEIEHRHIPDEGVTYRTHAERRKAERERYQSSFETTRPSTSLVHVRDGPNGKETIDSFRKMQTREGIFISALESSSDWRTSYDFLGPVKSGLHQQFEISEERETIDKEPEEGHDTSLDPIEFNKTCRLVEESNKKPEPEPASETELSQQEIPKKVIRVKRKGKVVNKEKGGENNKRNIAQPEIKKKTHEYGNDHFQYPYEVRELEEIKGQPKRMKLRHEPSGELSTLLSTEWCEETDGRREWHVNMRYSPASSVDSPPHVPVDPDAIDPNTIPPEFPNGEIQAIEVPKRRCPHNPDRCCSWWAHAPDECWVVQSEQVPRPVSPHPLSHPLMDIAPPKDFSLPYNGRYIYWERIADQYGVIGQEGVDWPRVGVRVPYEPMTYDDLKLNPESKKNEALVDGDTVTSSAPQVPADPSEGVDDANINTNANLPTMTALEGKSMKVFEIHSLTAPLVPMSPGRAFGATDPPSSSGDNDMSDSDVENDLFFISYGEGTSVGPPPSDAAMVGTIVIDET